MRQQSSQGSSSSNRGSVSSQGKRHSHSHSQPAPPYTPPHTPTKTRTSSSSSTSSAQSVASPQSKHKPSQFSQGERPQSPRSHSNQSPTHRGALCTQPQPFYPQHQTHPQHHPQTQAVEVKDAQQSQVPLLCLPPEGELSEGEGAETSALQKKRARSLNRYAVSDGECDEPAGGRNGGEAPVAGGQGSAVPKAEGGKYATVTHRVSRSHSVRNQDKSASRNQTQSFALRQKKKGPPPPPPKRSSSAISSSNSNLADANTQPQTHATTGGMLDVPYHQQRRASDLGVSVETAAPVETNSAGSVRSIAAMLEMSSIGGGAKGMALQKNFLQVRKVRQSLRRLVKRSLDPPHTHRCVTVCCHLSPGGENARGHWSGRRGREPTEDNQRPRVRTGGGREAGAARSVPLAPALRPYRRPPRKKPARVLLPAAPPSVVPPPQLGRQWQLVGEPAVRRRREPDDSPPGSRRGRTGSYL